MSDLAGRVAIVTGASRGIGAAVAAELACRGAAVVLGARDGAGCRALARRLEEQGRSAFGLSCDVADQRSVGSMVEAAIGRYGRVDILVNNAGVVAPLGRLAECDPTAWARNVEVNLIGAFRCVHAVLPAMLAAGAGTVVNVSSGAAHRPFTGWSAYCASKSGLAMLTRTIDDEYRSRGIRAFGFAPGVVDTAMQDEIRRSGAAAPGHAELVAPDRPARAIAWLCSDESGDLAGRDLDLRERTFQERSGVR